MSVNRETQVLVVGAGPTGLTLALLLRRLGVQCTLIEKNAGPSRTSKAIGLQYRVAELLEWLGLYQRFVECAATQSSVNLYADGKLLTRLVMDALSDRAGIGGFVPRPIIIPQSDTERLLGEGLREAGGDVEWGRELHSFTPNADRVEARLASGEHISAQFLVSCEGAHGVVRKQAQIGFDGTTYPQDFIMADVEMQTALSHAEAHCWLHPDGVLSAIGMPGPKRWRLFIEAGQQAEGEVTLELVRAIFAKRSGDCQAELVDPTWLTRFKIHARMVERFRAGRVFLAGDAAHLHSPSGGQGITTGMQDAYNLGWKLAQVIRANADPALLDSYELERLPAARAVLTTTDRNTRLFFASGTFGKWFRNHVSIPLLGTAPIQRRLLSKLSQLDVTYRASPLAVHATGLISRGKLRAGDRAPDIQLQTEAGTITSLFEQLRAGRWIAWAMIDPASEASRDRVRRVLELCASLGIMPKLLTAQADSASGALSDVHGDARRIYGMRGECLLLVRPDGYLGLVSRPIREPVVVDYLSRFWPAAARMSASAPAPARGLPVD